MNDLPFPFAQLCLDIKQWAIELGDPELPHVEGVKMLISSRRSPREAPRLTKRYKQQTL
jgi:hypothetical protein